MVSASGSKSVVRSSLYPEFVPDCHEVMVLKELDLIGDEAGAVLLVGRVLKVPASLLLLNEATERLLLISWDALFHDTPNL